MRILFAALCVVASLTVASPVEAAVYQVPVPGSVVDSFRPPASTYGAGNRGWEYSVAPGSPVEAASNGVVTFAGQVGGTLTVVIQHDDGVRTTLSKLAAIDPRIVVGAPVVMGEPVGTASTDVYFGARCGNDYLDPALLLGGQVHLVPLDAIGARDTATFTCKQFVPVSNLSWLESQDNGTESAPMAVNSSNRAPITAIPAGNSAPRTGHHGWWRRAAAVVTHMF